ncbi:NitT/TauT family transport system substrate-binding protein [Nocardiopsis arvandica]|uniref:NitT/TauT family transport system substrate-binding protein n=1 Tax=Nocardiopsis sinuspersici TaxID=501010 RepID=A0A7Y9XG41_9ACTN|nr:ABC transporter substrate-binding protein [Nocardiopsis sinuspersici]NYH55079.1 NitT/TauT family transport system substrate-binding protein [Nocardiopsis sinuspersici]
MRRTLAALTTGAVLLAATACGSQEADSDSGGLTTVTAGVIPIVDVAPVYLGVEQGFFEERGIDLRLESSSGGAAIVPGVISGEFDLGFSNIVSLIVARGQGLPLTTLTNGVTTTGEQGADMGGVFVQDDSSIQDAGDLEGLTVASNNLKNIGDTTVRQSVRVAGGDPSSVKFVELPFPDMPAALDSGQVDAVWAVEPFASIIRQAGHREIASNFVDTHSELSVAAYFASEQRQAEDPELFADVTAALEESMAYAQDNPDEVRRTISTYTEIDQGVIDELVLPRFPSEINRESVRTLADLMVTDGLVDSEPDLDALYGAKE